METFIHQFNINEKICDDLIEYHKKNTEYKGEGTINTGEVDKSFKDSIDVSVYPSSQNLIIKNYYKEINEGIDQYYKKYKILNEGFNCHTDEPLNLQYYAPGGGFKKWHCERRINKGYQISRFLVFMTYLNDVTDAGETEWLYQKTKIQPKKGLSVIWPSDFTHTHRGIPSLSQEKYIATGWYNII